MELRKTYRFEASHVLPKHPGKCSRLHGHSWVLHVMVEGPVDKETGFVLDYGDISKAVDPLIEALDHKHLGCWEIPDKKYGGMHVIHAPEENYVPGMPLSFYPTSENVLIWIAERLMRWLPQWSGIAIEETCTSCATLTRDEYELIRMVDKVNVLGVVVPTQTRP